MDEQTKPELANLERAILMYYCQSSNCGLIFPERTAEDNDLELGDIMAVAGNLKTSDELKNLRALLPSIHSYSRRKSSIIKLYNPDIDIAVVLDYEGPRDFRAKDFDAKNYFEDLGAKVGLRFQNVRPNPGILSRSDSRNYEIYVAQVIAASGNPVNVIITQKCS